MCRLCAPHIPRARINKQFSGLWIPFNTTPPCQPCVARMCWGVHVTPLHHPEPEEDEAEEEEEKEGVGEGAGRKGLRGLLFSLKEACTYLGDTHAHACT